MKKLKECEIVEENEEMREMAKWKKDLKSYDGRDTTRGKDRKRVRMKTECDDNRVGTVSLCRKMVMISKGRGELQSGRGEVQGKQEQVLEEGKENMVWRERVKKNAK